MKKTSLSLIAVVSVAVLLILAGVRCFRGPGEAEPHKVMAGDGGGESLSDVGKNDTEGTIAQEAGPAAEEGEESGAIIEARQAIIMNNKLKCIKILEKAKPTGKVLKFLASCYKAAGDMDRYYETIRQYILKYPTAPDAEKFRAILKDAGKL